MPDSPGDMNDTVPVFESVTVRLVSPVEGSIEAEPPVKANWRDCVLGCE